MDPDEKKMGCRRELGKQVRRYRQEMVELLFVRMSSQGMR